MPYQTWLSWNLQLTKACGSSAVRDTPDGDGARPQKPPRVSFNLARRRPGAKYSSPDTVGQAEQSNLTVQRRAIQVRHPAGQSLAGASTPQHVRLPSQLSDKSAGQPLCCSCQAWPWHVGFQRSAALVLCQTAEAAARHSDTTCISTWHCANLPRTA